MTHPNEESHPSDTHTSPLLSLHTSGGPPLHVPPLHVSAVVQAFPSLQVATVWEVTHPTVESHPSDTQTSPLLSSHTNGGPPLHVPPLHVSVVVQASPSLHDAVVWDVTHPKEESHPSDTQTSPLLSLQTNGGPPLHVPPLHVSAVVQASPSLHDAVVWDVTHPVAESQESDTHGSPAWALHTRAEPPLHVPPLHVSAVVHSSPSLHDAVVWEVTHPKAESHPSDTQTSPLFALHVSGGPPLQVPPLHVSAVVQASPSSHDAVVWEVTHPKAESHPSETHESAAFMLHTRGGPPLHVPPPHVSPVVQASPSLHDAVVWEVTHPKTESHPSDTQVLPLLSLQINGGPPLHVPPLHVSAVVQAFPSSHVAVVCEVTHPEAESHPSDTQAFPLLSLQINGGPPLHVPPLHVSAVVQAFPSSHVAVVWEVTHPEAESHPSDTQAFPLLSLQIKGGPPLHVPALHVSAVVQAFPSSHDAVVWDVTHPEAESHPSDTHTSPLLESHVSGGPPLHVPALHVSAVVQAFPSSQDAVVWDVTHPEAESHPSDTHTFPALALHTLGVPLQEPVSHVSPVVQASPSSQAAVLSSV